MFVGCTAVDQHGHHREWNADKKLVGEAYVDENGVWVGHGSFLGGSVNDTAGGSGTIAKPGGTADGDTILLWTIDDGTGNVTTWPGGFVEDSLSPLNTSGLDGGQLRWAWKVASGEGASWNITTGGIDRRGGAVWTGRNPTTPIHRISARTDTTTRSSPWTATSSAFSSNTTLDGCDIGFLVEDDCNASGAVVHTAPTNFTKGPEHAGANFCNGCLSYRDNVAVGEDGVYAGTGTLAGASTNLSIVAFALASSEPPPFVRGDLSPLPAVARGVI